MFHNASDFFFIYTFKSHLSKTRSYSRQIREVQRALKRTKTKQTISSNNIPQLSVQKIMGHLKLCALH